MIIQTRFNRNGLHLIFNIYFLYLHMFWNFNVMFLMFLRLNSIFLIKIWATFHRSLFFSNFLNMMKTFTFVIRPWRIFSNVTIIIVIIIFAFIFRWISFQKLSGLKKQETKTGTITVYFDGTVLGVFILNYCGFWQSNIVSVILLHDVEIIANRWN